MKLVSTPYRWLWRTVWENISHWFYDIKNGVSNLFTFFNAVWWFRSWDWSGMICLLEVSARQMRKDQEIGIHVGDAREARRLLIVETLCDRLLADNYFEKAGHDPKTWHNLPNHECRRIIKHSEYMAKQDACYLGRMLQFVQNWWT